MDLIEYSNGNGVVNTNSNGHKADFVLTEIVAEETAIISELTQEEQNALKKLELQVEKSFFFAGKALQEIRDQRLYRITHSRFEDYCRDRFGFHRRHPYHLIDAAKVVDNLTSAEGTEFVGILPTKESQCRPLTPLEADIQRSAWQQAVTSAGGKVPSTKIVKNVVRHLKRAENAVNPHHVGEVCLILAQDNPNLKGKNKCWAIVIAVQEHSCHLQLWNQTIDFVEMDYLKPLDYSPDECKNMQDLATRLLKLHDAGALEESTDVILKHFGKIRRPQLTPMEEKLLTFLEQESGISFSPTPNS